MFAEMKRKRSKKKNKIERYTECLYGKIWQQFKGSLHFFIPWTCMV